MEVMVKIMLVLQALMYVFKVYQHTATSKKSTAYWVGYLLTFAGVLFSLLYPVVKM